MKLSIFSVFIAALAAKVTAQAGFLIPEDLPDGVYSASHSSTGADNFSLLNELSSSLPTTAPSSRITRRQTGGATSLPSDAVPICQSYDGFWQLELSQCFWQAMSDWSGSGRWAGNNEAVVIKKGSAVVYMCCYDGANTCPAWYNELAAAQVAWNTKGCEAGKAAYVTIPSWKKHYGRTVAGRKICAAGIQT